MSKSNFEYFEELQLDTILNNACRSGVSVRSGMRRVYIGIDTVLDMLMVLEDNGYKVNEMIEDRRKYEKR